VTNTSTPRRTTAKVVGSIGVVGVAAAVAGLGTFGTFTDSTTPVDTGVGTGVLSIELGMAANVVRAPYLPGGLLPGDVSTSPIDLVNDGTIDLSSVVLEIAATESSILDSDPLDGLQMTVTSCSAPWTVDGVGYTCTADETEFYSGPVVMDEPLVGAASLEAGGVDHLLISASLPATADNTFQDAESELTVVFTGTQRGGTAR
jgi:hypothetical protein